MSEHVCECGCAEALQDRIKELEAENKRLTEWLKHIEDWEPECDENPACYLPFFAEEALKGKVVSDE